MRFTSFRVITSRVASRQSGRARKRPCDKWRPKADERDCDVTPRGNPGTGGTFRGSSLKRRVRFTVVTLVSFPRFRHISRLAKIIPLFVTENDQANASTETLARLRAVNSAQRSLFWLHQLRQQPRDSAAEYSTS